MSLQFVSLVDIRMDVVWLRRELGISVVKVTEDELVERASLANQRVGLVVADPKLYLSLLSGLPRNRVVILQLYDERYTRPVRDLCSVRSVFRAYRTFSIDRLSTARYVALVVMALTDARIQSASARQVAAALKSGIKIRSSARRYARRNDDRYHLVPIGYTNAFAAAFEQVVGPVADDHSLFDLVLGPHGAQLHDHDRPTEVSFRGARGQFQRRAGVHLASKQPNSECSSPTRGWSGRGDALDPMAYLDLLMTSRFSLCPPGYSCNESYRVYESLLCGALPVMLSSAVSQGTLPPDHLGELVTGPCWTVALRRMARMPEPERRAAVTRALARSRSAYRSAADSIRASMVSC